MRLVTKWFGTFLVEEEKVVGKTLFPADVGELAKRLRSVNDGEILPEEEELVGDREVTVGESRLELLGAFTTEPTAEIPPEEHGFDPGMLGQVMVLLGREKVKASGTPDQQIVQAIRTIDDLTKTINLMSERLREWQGINFPELEKLVPETRYLELVAEYGDRDSMTKSGALDMTDSVGSDIAEEDAAAIRNLARSILSVSKTRDEMEKFVQERMAVVAKNTARVAGPLIGARLMSLTGGLERLAKLPSSTVQLLGAEKALFKHLKDNARPPKHGVIFQHPMVHRAPPWQRGKIARAFASKISIAAKVDWNGDRFIGEELEQELSKRVKDIQKRYPTPPRKGGKRGKR